MLTLNQFFSPTGGNLLQTVVRKLESDADALLMRTTLVEELKKLKSTMLAHDIAKQFGKLLDVRMVDIMVNAWNKSIVLRKHLDKTKPPSNETVLLPLVDHTITSEHSPYVEILKNGKQIAKFVFPINVALILEGIVLKIQNGEIKEIRTGQVKAKGSIKCGRLVIVEKEFQPVQWPGSIVLGQMGLHPVTGE